MQSRRRKYRLWGEKESQDALVTLREEEEEEEEEEEDEEEELEGWSRWKVSVQGTR